MIEIVIQGEGRVWIARVNRKRYGDLWLRIKDADAPVVEGSTAGWAAEKAVRAWRRYKGPRVRCERCGYEWQPRAKEPKKCARCDRAPRYVPGSRGRKPKVG